MPKSEAHLDACADNLRVRLHGFSDSVGGVRFVDGEAIDPMPTRVLTRLLGIGLPLVVVGPWAEQIPLPAATSLTPEPPAEPVELEREAPPRSELAIALGSMIDETVASVAIENAARTATAHATEMARLAGRAPRRR